MSNVPPVDIQLLDLQLWKDVKLAAKVSTLPLERHSAHLYLPGKKL
jgi:hypothetical protein